MGDFINAHLFGDGGEQFNLLSLLKGALITIGTSAEDIPDPLPIIRQVVGSCGGEEFGISKIPPPHQPGVQPVQLLKIIWPFAQKIFTLPLHGELEARQPPLDETVLPAIAAVVASQLLHKTKHVLDPKVFFAIAMEAAIIAAKVDPDDMDPGRWRLEAEAGKLRVFQTQSQ